MKLDILEICVVLLLLLLLPAESFSQDDLLVWRAQVQIRTCNVHDAKTDNAVYCMLKSGNKTYLNYPRNDFERGDTFTYDLTLKEISILGDIDFLTVKKNGSNGWCISRLTFIINETTVYERSFSGGRWLDNSEADRTLTISRSELISHPLWSQLNLTRTIVSASEILRNDLESIITCYIATEIHGKKLKWGPKHGRAVVQVGRKNSSTLKVDLDMHLDISGWFDPQVDINFDIKLCENGEPVFQIENMEVQVDSRWYSEAIFGIGQIIDSNAQSKIQSKLKSIKTLDSSSPICYSIDAEGNVKW